MPLTRRYDDYGVTPYGELLAANPIRLAGGVFSGAVQNPLFFAVSATNGGTIVQANSQIVLSTGTTANGSASVTSAQIGRLVGGTSNHFYARLYLGDAGVAGNVRRWGLISADKNNGAYFKLSGTALYVCTLKGGVETALLVSAPVTLTNMNLYGITYNSGQLEFSVCDVDVYSITVLSPYANTTQFYCFADSVNSGGASTNVSMAVLQLTIYRFGCAETQAIAGRITTPGTYNLKYGPGTLHKITLNNPGGTLITVYDSITGAGTTLAVIDTPAQANPVTLHYDVQFSNGLTVVSTGTWDVTVVYQ